MKVTCVWLPSEVMSKRPGDGLTVLTLRDTKICAITRFETSVLPHFGLARSLRSA